MKLRTIAVLAFVLLTALSVGKEASAHDTAYPPLAEACDRYPGETWDVPADEVVEAYSGCFINETVDASGDITCPGGTVAKGNYCVPVVDHHVDNGGDCPATLVEVVGGTVDVVCVNTTEFENGQVYYDPMTICHSGAFVARLDQTMHFECVGPDYGAEYPDDGGHQPWREGPRGTCADWMDGYACELWQSGYNFPDENNNCSDPAYPELIPGDVTGLGVDTCQAFNADDAPAPEVVEDTTSAPEDKDVYPVTGYAYVTGTNGDGLVCRDAPDGAPLTTLPEGTLVTRLENYVAAGGWQRVAYQESETVFPSCFAWADYLSDAPKDSDVYESGADTGSTDEVEITLGPVNGPTDSDEVLTVTALPETGHGPQHARLQSNETEPTLTPEQRKWGLVVTAILFVGLLKAQPWKSPQGR